MIYNMSQNYSWYNMQHHSNNIPHFQTNHKSWYISEQIRIQDTSLNSRFITWIRITHGTICNMIQESFHIFKPIKSPDTVLIQSEFSIRLWKQHLWHVWIPHGVTLYVKQIKDHATFSKLTSQLTPELLHTSEFMISNMTELLMKCHVTPMKNHDNFHMNQNWRISAAIRIQFTPYSQSLN